MKLIKAYLKGLKNGAFNIKITFLIYAINVILVLLLAIPFYSAISEVAGNSMAVAKLFKAFDLNAVMEWYQASKGAIAGLISQMKWIAAFWLILNIFFIGGILTYLFIPERKITLSGFLEPCGGYFVRFLKVSLIMILLQIVVAAIIYLPMALIISGLEGKVTSEAIYFWIVFGAAILHLLLFCWLMMVSDYAKIIMFIDDSKKTFTSIKNAFKFTFRHFFKAYFLFLLLVATPVGMILLYLLLSRIFGDTTIVTMLIMFAIQQAYIISRIFTKIWFYGSELYFYTYYEPVKESKSVEVKVVV